MKITLTTRIASALAAGALLSATVPAVAAAPAHAFLSPAARGLATGVGRVRDVRDLGRLAPATKMTVGFLMRFRHEDELARLTRLQSQKGSPYYHHFVSVAQWNNYFAPDVSTYERTARTMQRAGFRPLKTYANRGLLVMQAPASTVERYFHTEMHRVAQIGHGERYANMRPALMPSELRSTVVSVSGIHTTQSMFVPYHPQAGRFGPRRAQAMQRLARLFAPQPFARRSVATASPSPKPVAVVTPSPNPSPDPTESPNQPAVDYANTVYGLGPPSFAIGYDYPVQHGFGGTGHAAGTVINSDNSDNDMALEFAAFDIPNTGYETRVCTDPANSCTICDATASKAGTPALCDAEGESTLDAEAIRTEAPDAHLIEYLINKAASLIDLNVTAAYERVVNDDMVDAVNSSFGGCETDDPSEEYAVNYIAMEGAAKGISFMASAGDTGALNCGVYATNGAPQTEINVAEPCAAYYFTCVGGTSYDPPESTALLYVGEQAWLDGGGGYSVLEPLPDWQMASVASAVPTSVSTLGRNTPDVAMVADAGAGFIGGTQGVGLAIVTNGTPQGSGGTSLASPMFVAMQTTIDQAARLPGGSGWLNPRLFQIQQNAAGYAAAFRDITTSANFVYAAAPGYDDATGIGSPIGWELAGEE